MFKLFYVIKCIMILLNTLIVFLMSYAKHELRTYYLI